MKKCFFLVIIFVSKIALAQTIISYGNYTVSKDEFLRAYNKNKTPVEDKEKAIREYAELYTNFKLKVRAAQDLRIDTLNQIKNDVENFRHQVEENYLNDETTFKVLLNEALRRSQQDLRVFHYSIQMDPNDKSEDTLQKYQTIFSFYNNLKNGAPNLKIPEGIKASDLGYITVFSLPYQYENIVYGLKLGEFSQPYRSKKAWHIFQITDQRESVGKWKLAQILLTFPPNPDDNIKTSIKKRIDSIYLLLKNGVDFSKMATNVSEDKLSNTNGGEMPEFGVGKFDYSFEKEINNLKTDGEISKPFETAFGYHIIKRIKYTPTPQSIDDENLQFEIKQKLMQEERIRLAKEKFYTQISKKIGLKLYTSVKEKELYRYADSVISSIEAKATLSQPISNQPIIGFIKGAPLKGKDWLAYVRDYKLNNELYNGETNEQIWKRYIETSSLEYYKKHLEEFNADFAYQLQEFKEGNLLFEVMDKEVWTRASTDSVGLLKYYNSNKEKYIWGASADALVMNCTTEDLAQEMMNELKSGKTWQSLVELKEGEVQADSNRFELIQINASASAMPGSYSEITKNPDGTATFIKYYQFYPAGLQRSFSDSKGLLVNDYQTVVEKTWVDQLRKKYPVKINESLLINIIKGQ